MPNVHERPTVASETVQPERAGKATAAAGDRPVAMHADMRTLADGEPVDMGEGPGAVAGAERSPDVQYNRRWLRAALLGHRFHGASADGLHFTPAPPPALEIAAH